MTTPEPNPADAPEPNLVLRRAMSDARLRDVDVAASLGVDPKTVQRWLGGRLPQPRHRWALADLVKHHEYDLWPQLVGTPTIAPEIVATYANRAAVPRRVWRRLFESAQREISILVYSGLFIAEDAELMRIMADQAAAGVSVRVLLGDPDCDHVAERGREEGIGDAMAAKIRNALVLYQPLLEAPGVELRLHSSVLYNSIYRADDELLINQHIYATAAAYAPVLHLRGRPDGDLLSTYITSFNKVWAHSHPVPASI